ncbi:hypothetical protein [Roseibium album]|uniref:hypothetical protein n=1 Tax=Roseibium album TaxID=311410 RepID=UPI0024900661|nr:hypothetical protein [Roseibium album]
MPRFDYVFNRLLLPFDLTQPSFVLTACYRESLSLKPVLNTGPVLDERHALDLQLLEFMLTLADNLVRFQVERRPHCRQHGYIHLVGLGLLSTRLSKAARLMRFHFDKRETVRKQLFERTVDLSMRPIE